MKRFFNKLSNLILPIYWGGQGFLLCFTKTKWFVIIGIILLFISILKCFIHNRQYNGFFWVCSVIYVATSSMYLLLLSIMFSAYICMLVILLNLLAVAYMIRKNRLIAFFPPIYWGGQGLMLCLANPQECVIAGVLLVLLSASRCLYKSHKYDILYKICIMVYFLLSSIYALWLFPHYLSLIGVSLNLLVVIYMASEHVLTKKRKKNGITSSNI